MAFPFSVSGSFDVQGRSGTTDIQELLVAETEALLRTRSDDVATDGQTIISRPSFMAWFSAPGTNWHPMVAFDDVQVTVSGGAARATIRYMFSTRRILKITTCMAIGFATFILVTSEFDLARGMNQTALGYAAFAFAWLFGGNYVFGAFRGPRWLRRHLQLSAMMPDNDEERRTARHII